MATEKGNTTTYEWIYGERPERVDDTEDKIEIVAETNAADEIDWDISVSNETDYSNYGISLDESGIEVELPNKNKNKASGNEMFSVLDNPKTRDEFISQLLEVSLSAFIRPFLRTA